MDAREEIQYMQATWQTLHGLACLLRFPSRSLFLVCFDHKTLMQCSKTNDGFFALAADRKTRLGVETLVATAASEQGFAREFTTSHCSTSEKKKTSEKKSVCA